MLLMFIIVTGARCMICEKNRNLQITIFKKIFVLLFLRRRVKLPLPQTTAPPNPDPLDLLMHFSFAVVIVVVTIRVRFTSMDEFKRELYSEL